MIRVFAPLVFFLIFYWRGLGIYFYQDDFGWLNLRLGIETWPDLIAALFTPKAHGNLRPWSENGFFLLLSWLFGPNPLPFRICVFVTQFANLLLLGAIVRRLTSSAYCALWTQLFWIVNSCVAMAACWTSIYNQFQYILFILGAFYLLLRGHYVAQWIIFLLGFGALEVNIVYPALASLYALLYARPLLRRTLPMFAVSALYAALHFAVAPHAAEGAYALHFDARIVATLWAYWRMALGPERFAQLAGLPEAAGAALTGILTAAIAAFVVWRARRRDWLPFFALGWFAILLAPLLPLSDHISDYYLTGPAIGLALLLAWALHCSPRFAAPAVGLYLAVSVPAAWWTTTWNYERAESVEYMIAGVERARELHPAKPILLAGIGQDQFDASIAHVPFLALRIPGVYLAPGSGHTTYELPEGLAADAVVYDASGRILRNVTSQFRRRWKPGPPRMVNPGDPIFAAQLGGDWEPPHAGYRRMGARATVRMAGPAKSGEQLHIGVFCEAAPLRFEIELPGVQTSRTFTRCDTLQEFALALPFPLSEEISVSFSSDPAGGARFGYLEIR